MKKAIWGQTPENYIDGWGCGMAEQEEHGQMKWKVQGESD